MLPKLITKDQTGYAKGQYIGQTIRLIDDIMKITEIENIPGIITFIDFKKAFYTVDWNFLFKTSEVLNILACNFTSGFTHFMLTAQAV